MSRLFLRRALCVLAFVPCLAFAQDAADAPNAPEAASTLTLADAVTRALQQQPQIIAEQARARAARALAVADRQLPDPRLSAGIKDFPIEDPAAGSSTGDDFTMLEVGISQDFPRAEKRRLKSARRLREAEVADAMAEQLQRVIRRDAGIAWLEVFLPEQSQLLVEALYREAELLAQTSEIAFRSGRAPQSEVLSARVSAELLADRARGLHQQAREARGTLSRWIGESAQAPIAGALPELEPPPPLTELLGLVEKHPHLLALASVENLARTDIALAEQDYSPDWSLEAYYGNRLAYAGFVGVRVTFDLPAFTAHRQDQRLEASRARLSSASAEREDAQRLQAAQVRSAYTDWQELSIRLERFDQAILPPARGAVKAAQAAYGAGQGTLNSVLQARQSVLDAELQRLTLAVDSLRAQLRLRYLFEQE